MTDCIFCAIIFGEAPANILMEWNDAIAIMPRNPVVPDHTLVLPITHVDNAAEQPDVTAATMRRAAEYARLFRSANLITSIGSAATQTVFHLHVHVVPRKDGDGLLLPWS